MSQSQDVPDSHAADGQQGDDGRHRGLHEHGCEYRLADGDQRIDFIMGVDMGPASIPGRGCVNSRGAVRFERQDLELGRPGIWLRIDLEKPPSTQMSWPVT